MRHTIKKKQENSKHCFACGLENPAGLKASFYEMDDGAVAAVFTPGSEYQSYPGRMHGGISAALLDEVMGRAIMAREPGVWGVTMTFQLRYQKPVPLGVTLLAVARVTRDSRRGFEAVGELLLADSTPAVTAEGKYIKLPMEKIVSAEGQADDRMFLAEGEQEPLWLDY